MASTTVKMSPRNMIAEAADEQALRDLIHSEKFLAAVRELPDEEVVQLRDLTQQLFRSLRYGNNLPWKNLKDLKDKLVTLISISRPLETEIHEFGKNDEPGALGYRIVVRAKFVNGTQEEFKYSLTSNQRLYRQYEKYRLAERLKSGPFEVVHYKNGPSQQAPWRVDLPRKDDGLEELPF